MLGSQARSGGDRRANTGRSKHSGRGQYTLQPFDLDRDRELRDPNYFFMAHFHSNLLDVLLAQLRLTSLVSAVPLNEILDAGVRNKRVV